jgi:hypothetical protein
MQRSDEESYSAMNMRTIAPIITEAAPVAAVRAGVHAPAQTGLAEGG